MQPSVRGFTAGSIFLTGFSSNNDPGCVIAHDAASTKMQHPETNH
jgi:hypothetical protein